MKLLLALLSGLLLGALALCVVRASDMRADPATRELWRSAGHASLLGLGALLGLGCAWLTRRMWRAAYAEGLAWDLAVFGPLTPDEERARRRSILRRQAASFGLALLLTALMLGVLMRLHADRWIPGAAPGGKAASLALIAPLVLGVNASRRIVRNRVAGFFALWDTLRRRFGVTETIPPHWRPRRDGAPTPGQG